MLRHATKPVWGPVFNSQKTPWITPWESTVAPSGTTYAISHVRTSEQPSAEKPIENLRHAVGTISPTIIP